MHLDVVMMTVVLLVITCAYGCVFISRDQMCMRARLTACPPPLVHEGDGMFPLPACALRRRG